MVAAARSWAQLWLARIWVLTLAAEVLFAVMYAVRAPWAGQALGDGFLLEAVVTVSFVGLLMWDAYDQAASWETDSRYRQPGGDDDVAWEPVNTLADLGDFGARWLTGEVRSRPAYTEGVGPDPETVPYLTELGAVSRAGFFTTYSQPGLAASGLGTTDWIQQAEVRGFADGVMCDRLRRAAEARGLHFFAYRSQAKPVCAKVNVSYGGDPVATRGGWKSARVIRRDFQPLSPRAIATLIDAWQVTIIDPGFGNDQLWPLLAEVAAQGQTGKDLPSAASVRRCVWHDRISGLLGQACGVGIVIAWGAVVGWVARGGMPPFAWIPLAWPIQGALAAAFVGWRVWR